MNEGKPILARFSAIVTQLQSRRLLTAQDIADLDVIPEGMIGRSFEGGNYVKTTAKGDLMKGLIVVNWTEIWNMDLDRRYTADFEVFGEKAQDPQNAEVDFYIAIE